MKKIFIIICGIFISLLSNPVFAQAEPGDDPEVPAAPIDNYAWLLAVVGLVYVFYKVRALSLQRK